MKRISNYRTSMLVALLCATPVAHGQAASGAQHYVQAKSGSSLHFTFSQLGASTGGQFRQFATDLVYDEANPAASTLQVIVQIGSVDTQDAERDGVLAAPELFDTAQHPTATFVAKSFTRVGDGLEAVGRLTIRGVTRELRLPLTIRNVPTGLELTGQTSIRRLDFGVGQGDWASTDSVGNEVGLRYKVLLERAR